MLRVENLLEENIDTLITMVDSQEEKITEYTLLLDLSLNPNSDTLKLIHMEMDAAAIREAIREKENEVSFKILNINVILN